MGADSNNPGVKFVTNVARGSLYFVRYQNLTIMFCTLLFWRKDGFIKFSFKLP